MYIVMFTRAGGLDNTKLASWPKSKEPTQNIHRVSTDTVERPRVLNLINPGGGDPLCTSSRRTAQLGYTQGV